MKRENQKRIAIIGLPGSGKSTFAIKLGKLLNIPVHHLDSQRFDGKNKRDKSEFLAFKESILKEEAWIIEGCSFSTLEMRFARATTVIYFNLPRMLCIWRVCRRLFTLDKHTSETGCLNGVNWTLIKYTWNFNRDKRQGIEQLSRRYPEVEFLIFQHSHDVDKYLENVKKFDF